MRKAIKLINEGFLDTAGVDDLADRLGIGSRHLSRLFSQYMGASPSQMAATRRVQAAKRLIDETDLPLSTIAFEAGFQSIRRFNDAFKTVYKRPPSAMRR